MRHLIFVIPFLFIFLSCDEEASFLSKYSPENPARVRFTFEISDNSQRVIADSISCKLVPRLQVFSKERGDFILVKTNEPAEVTCGMC